MKYLLPLLLLLPSLGQARELRLLEAGAVSMDFHRVWHLLDPALTPQEGEYYSHGVQMNLDTTLIQYSAFQFYWNHKVRGDSTQRQFRYVAWEHEAGVQINKISVGWFHHSQHVLDQEMSNTPYPLNDRLFLRLHFLGH